MSRVPEDLRYTKEHEWARREEGRVVVGITDHAQLELTDVVYVELPTVGSNFQAGEEFVVVESVKAASEVFAPLSGTITAVNEALEERPELINQDPYDQGWIAAFAVEDPAEWEALLTPEAYRKLIEE